MEFMPELSIAGVATFITAFLMVFGGAVPYIFQYKEIRRTNNAEGFSTLVCFTLLLANILRIWFWFGHAFETPLLLQSIVMIVTMLIMVHLCTSVRSKSEIIPDPKPKSFTDDTAVAGDTGGLVQHRHAIPPSLGLSGPPASVSHSLCDLELAYFWKWTDFESYLQCLGVISLVTGFLTYILLDSLVFIETLGFFAVFFEAMLGAPQFYRNFQNKSTKGMSLVMVLCWTSGDVFKTGYFIVRQAPLQFYLCGALQVGLDILILSQVVFYGSNSPNKKAIQ